MFKLPGDKLFSKAFYNLITMRTLAYFLDFASGMFSQQPSKYVTQGGHHINIVDTRLSHLLRATTCVGPLDLKERCKQDFAH